MVNNFEEIKKLEEQLREAELGPDPNFFKRHIADDAIIDGEFAKAKIVRAHTLGNKQKFTDVKMSEMKIIDHGDVAVVTCMGTYKTSEKIFTLKFMRVWMKKDGVWQIIAGSISQ